MHRAMMSDPVRLIQDAPLLDQVQRVLGCGWTLAAEVLARMRRRPQWAFKWDAAAFDRLAWETLESIEAEDDDPDWEIVATNLEEELAWKARVGGPAT